MAEPTAPKRRFYVVSADAATIAGFDNQEGAEAAAIGFGDGSHVVDTMAQPYQPALLKVEDGVVSYVGFGSFDKRLGDDGNLIEAARRGNAPGAHAFLARGGNPNAVDSTGSPALMWAVAKGDAETVRALLDAGADKTQPDADGMTPVQLAQEKNHADIVALLEG